MPVDFHVVSKQTFKLLNLEHGTASYLTLTFDDSHFIKSRVVIYSAILDLILNAGNHKDSKDKKKPIDVNNNSTISLYGNAKLDESVNKDDLQNLYKSFVSILVKNYEAIKSNFNEIKSLSIPDLNELNFSYKNFVVEFLFIGNTQFEFF